MASYNTLCSCLFGHALLPLAFCGCRGVWSSLEPSIQLAGGQWPFTCWTRQGTENSDARRTSSLQDRSGRGRHKLLLQHLQAQRTSLRIDVVASSAAISACEYSGGILISLRSALVLPPANACISHTNSQHPNVRSACEFSPGLCRYIC